MSGFKDFCIKTCDQYARQAGLPLYSELLAEREAKTAAAPTNQAGDFGDSSTAQLRQKLRHVPLPNYCRSKAGDWPEDFAHENGNYMNECCMCGLHFMGMKRRVTCKVCALEVVN